MNWLDIIILVILAFYVIRGLRIGLIQAAAGLVGLMAGIVLGILWCPFGATLLVDLIHNPKIALVISFITIVLGVYILIVRGVWLLNTLIGFAPFGLFNRLGGGLCAFLQSTLGLVVFKILMAKLPHISTLDVAVRESKIMNLISGLVPIVSSLLKFWKFK